MVLNKQALYFNMILGTIGNILIALVTMRYLVKEYDVIGYALTLLGFVFITSYISYLKKSRIEQKIHLD